MELLLDSNVILDHILNREPFAAKSRMVCLLGMAGEVRAHVSASMVTDIFYILCKVHGSIKSQELLEQSLSYLNCIAVSSEDVNDALAQKWPDFEDCLVAQCARKINADYIITRNVEDFERSSVKALTPEQLFDELEARGITYEEIDW